MSKVSICPTCSSKSKIKEKDGVILYKAIQEEDVFKKIGQLKKAMNKYKERAEKLEKELKTLKAEN